MPNSKRNTPVASVTPSDSAAASETELSGKKGRRKGLVAKKAEATLVPAAPTALKKKGKTAKKRKHAAITQVTAADSQKSETYGNETTSLDADKQIRKLEKQIRQIDWLKTQVDGGLTPSPEQTAKLAKRPAIEEQLLELRSKTGDLSGGAMDAKRHRGVVETESDAVKEFRAKHEIVVSGGVCTELFDSFDSAATGFGTPLTDALCKQGYKAPTPIQAMVWPVALKGIDVVAVAKTGSGKTMAFLMPALHMFFSQAGKPKSKQENIMVPSVLVLTPTRELAQQIATEAEKFHVIAKTRVVTLFGGDNREDQALKCKPGDAMVVATVGRLIDFTQSLIDFERHETYDALVSLKHVRYLVLDEADRMLDMGFGPDIRKIVAQCPKSSAGEDTTTTRQTLLFTATWPTEVQQTAASLSRRGAIKISIGQGSDGDNLTANMDVTQVVSVIDERQKLSQLKKLLDKDLGKGETAFVFAKTKQTCNYLEQKLWDEKEELSIGTWCRAIHSSKAQAERESHLDTFRKLTTGKDNGRKGILVATDVAARGLDIPGVAMVVIYDFAGGMLGEDAGVESYVHRIGRTGRAGKMGRAFTFFTARDVGAAKLVDMLRNSKQKVPDALQRLADRERSRKAVRDCSESAKTKAMEMAKEHMKEKRMDKAKQKADKKAEEEQTKATKGKAQKASELHAKGDKGRIKAKGGKKPDAIYGIDKARRKHGKIRRG
eukprot:TRINITY_DN516_c2_g1_i1.p1 TRINITY_DN516_c2_g1~~TRINITY_DN516_c2_g1_i1.p1  ORF type:complete len:718 (-),score=168.13 TRINITY_DN516_c2_g1_i1:187-2340(-)